MSIVEFGKKIDQLGLVIVPTGEGYVLKKRHKHLYSVLGTFDTLFDIEEYICHTLNG